ncbi:MAG: hypothetical protein HYZ45_01475 [Burkholderiales bacterium]|nr:hypothetical protein [Burkholderiales bacterium]
MQTPQNGYRRANNKQKISMQQYITPTSILIDPSCALSASVADDGATIVDANFRQQSR